MELIITALEQWNRLCQALRVPVDKKEKWWNKISGHYNEPQRYYHTLNHVESMIRWLAALREDPGEDVDRLSLQETSIREIILAVYFHE